MAGIPQSEIVILEQKLVIRLGRMMQISNVVFVEVTLQQTPEKIGSLLDRFDLLVL